MTLIAILHYIEAKFDYAYTIFFLYHRFLAHFDVIEGPQQGPSGSKGPEGPPALRRS